MSMVSVAFFLSYILAILKTGMRYRTHGDQKNINIFTGHFLNLTCNIRLFKNLHGNFISSDRGHCYFLNLTCHVGNPTSRALIFQVGNSLPEKK